MQKSVADVSSGSEVGRGWVYSLPNYLLIFYTGQIPKPQFPHRENGELYKSFFFLRTVAGLNVTIHEKC